MINIFTFAYIWPELFIGTHSYPFISKINMTQSIYCNIFTFILIWKKKHNASHNFIFNIKDKHINVNQSFISFHIKDKHKASQNFIHIYMKDKTWYKSNWKIKHGTGQNLSQNRTTGAKRWSKLGSAKEARTWANNIWPKAKAIEIFGQERKKVEIFD